MEQNLGISKEEQLGKKKKKKKATNDPRNKYFAWLRENKPECMVCGNYAEIHHLEQGYKRDDSRVVMLCTNHHSAQSMEGIHHGMKDWYKKYYSFNILEEVATDNHNEWSSNEN